MTNLQTDDRVKFRNRVHAFEQRIDEDTVGVVLRTYDLPACRYRVDVQFPDRELFVGWHQADFVLAAPKA
ncbi:hypothetical protein [Methylobacterium sp. OT2]|uniref:hypothetical protein n=1 Tax=Methylobacterium sp. OT2 TaxID=2813779 RepID=UPI00197B29DF|nr:hypothetical protein [Methylobacterium sp. OT2]MBN4095664.1 hypothetical protein [Methylobacterium sp. OT2]